jgi:hypothetical protein
MKEETKNLIERALSYARESVADGSRFAHGVHVHADGGVSIYAIDNDFMLTLFIGLSGCPPMYLEAFRKDCDAVHILDTRGVITQLPAEVRKYTAEEIAALKRKRESEGSKS